MNKTKLKWNKPEISDLSVKETEIGPNQAAEPDGAPWTDGKHWYVEIGES